MSDDELLDKVTFVLYVNGRVQLVSQEEWERNWERWWQRTHSTRQK